MGLYSRFVFPRLLDRIMTGEGFGEVRARLLSRARGETLEIGFGTGLNLPYYSDRVLGLTAIDPNRGMRRQALGRMAKSAIPVQHRELAGESLPFADSAFDCVVSTWTLCSVPDPGAALAQIRRVLKPDGLFLFAEHGLSPDPALARWQHRLTPVQKVVGDGCHLDRDIRALILNAGLSIREMDNFYLAGVPRIGGYLYVGSATRAGSGTSAPPFDMMRSISARSDADGSPQPSR